MKTPMLLSLFTALLIAFPLSATAFGGLYASQVIDSTTVTVGDANNILGEPNADTVAHALAVANFDGTPGYVTVSFDCLLADGSGNDFTVHLWDFRPQEPITGWESFIVAASANGTDFFDVGTADPVDYSFPAEGLAEIGFDLGASGLTQAAYIRITNDVIVPGGDSGLYEGPDIDAIELHNYVPEPATMGLLSLGGLAILKRRTNR